MDSLNQYCLALESFEKETLELDLDRQMSLFIGMEANVVVNKLKAGWNRLVELARHIWGLITKAAGAVKGAVLKLVGSIKRAPDRVEMDEDSAKVSDAFEKMVAENEATMERILKNHEQMYAAMERVMKANADADSVFEETDKMLDELLKATSEMIQEANAAMAMDSFVAMEAEGSGRKVVKPISSLKNAASQLAERARNAMSKNEEAVKAAKDGITKEANMAEDGEKVGLKQRILSKILRGLSMIGKFFASIPSKVAAGWRRIFQRTSTEKYDGPAPEVQVG